MCFPVQLQLLWGCLITQRRKRGVAGYKIHNAVNNKGNKQNHWDNH